VQLEEENMNEAEDTTFCINCGHSFSKDEAEEELTMQLRIFSAIRCHDPRCDGIATPRWVEDSRHLGCTSTLKKNNKWSSRYPHQLHEYPCHKIHVGFLFASTVL
jgi:hypothetical protein